MVNCPVCGPEKTYASFSNMWKHVVSQNDLEHKEAAKLKPPPGRQRVNPAKGKNNYINYKFFL